MGKISSQLVVTDSEKSGRTKILQPGDREWVTLVQGLEATAKRTLYLLTVRRTDSKNL